MKSALEVKTFFRTNARQDSIMQHTQLVRSAAAYERADIKGLARRSSLGTIKLPRLKNK
jgi:hypothetical protein